MRVQPRRDLHGCASSSIGRSMLRKWILAIAMVMTASHPPVLRSQSTQSMPGMSGMKDSVAKRKPASKKKKQTKPGKKKSTVARKRPVSAMKMPRQAHDSSAGTRVTDSMPAMPSMPPRSDSSRPMNMTDSAPMRDTSAMRMPMGMAMGSSRPMTADDMMICPLGVSMERMGSGTTWIQYAVTMPSRRTMMGSWMLMAHGFVFAQYDHQSGKRGDDQLGSVNWMMLMATKNLAGGRFQARTMLSLDALGVTSRGYPLLLQTGESFNGVLLHDRQHPHDFWMELGALYQRELSKTLGWSIYAAPSGEPALGPVAFMHRPSAMDNPTAPISHHWQDATHVTFGVLTGGLFARKFQIEGSLFNSRDPDQHRWNFDRIKLDSYSSRITFNPAAVWSLSAGYGFLRSHEAFDPAESMHRVTASVLNGGASDPTGRWRAHSYGAQTSMRGTHCWRRASSVRVKPFSTGTIQYSVASSGCRRAPSIWSWTTDRPRQSRPERRHFRRSRISMLRRWSSATFARSFEPIGLRSDWVGRERLTSCLRCSSRHTDPEPRSALSSFFG